MEKKIITESEGHCEWNELTYPGKCPYLEGMNYCNLYNVALESYEATDSWYGFDSIFINRCEQCIKEH